jgi:DDE superfamily endonuclease
LRFGGWRIGRLKRGGSNNHVDDENTNLLLFNNPNHRPSAPSATNQTMVTNGREEELVARMIINAYSQSAARKRKKKHGWRGKARVRKRVSMLEIYLELGAAYFKRAYRMSFETFSKLSNLLGYAIHRISRKEGSDPSVIRTGPNGRITPSVRLGCALRYFAGGSVYDIMTSMGIGRVDISRSCWIVVEAIKKCDKLDICYPEDHVEQRQIALGFQAKSAANFDCCAGCVDGILIWVYRPSEDDADVTDVGSSKFYCGRKHKFGLNCQAICDARGRFLDISIRYPGATSDVLSFEGAKIYKKLKDGLLAPGMYWILFVC